MFNGKTGGGAGALDSPTMDAPPIQYARTEDGVNIAYWTLGEGVPMVFAVPATGSHLGLEWAILG